MQIEGCNCPPKAPKKKTVLDATCGSRMMWFDKYDERALYVDRRVVDEQEIWKSGDGKGVRLNNIHPDIVADFTNLPFEDNSFYHVVFDPPHLLQLSENSWMYKKYGKLEKDTWKQVIHDGFHECMRVLKPNGTLIFKWCEYEILSRDVIEVIGCKPLYGHKSGKQQKTHWMAFIKEGQNEQLRKNERVRSKTGSGNNGQCKIHAEHENTDKFRRLPA